MYTEIVKIIEGGLVNDKEKVINYATVLANNLEKQGEIPLAKKIRSTLIQKKGALTSLDSFATKPVDAESRMDIVEVTYPQVDAAQIVLGKYTQEAIYNFIESYNRRDVLLKSGFDACHYCIDTGKLRRIPPKMCYRHRGTPYQRKGRKK